MPKTDDDGVEWLSEEELAQAKSCADEKTFDTFVESVGGHRIDGLHPNPGVLNADYVFPADKVIIELKTLETEIQNTHQFQAKMQVVHRQAILHLRAGACDIALAVGTEKMFFTDRPEKIAAAFLGGTDIHDLETTRAFVRELGGDIDDGTNGTRSVFMDLYAALAHHHMRSFGTTQEDLAKIASKNHAISVFNDKAQYRTAVSVAEVMADRLIAYPITRSMCAPVSDGAAAAVICTRRGLEKLAGLHSRAVRIRACALRSGSQHAASDHARRIGHLTALEAYSAASVSPEDIDVAEVHDASALGELLQIENLGLAPFGEVPAKLAQGYFAVGGPIPVNPSGGLICKGHPIGATGIAQMYELCLHLRNEARERQVTGARLGITENGGGWLRGEEASCVVSILEAPSR